MKNDRSSIFSSDFIDKPYWWDRTPRLNESSANLPRKVDVVVVGSGYTGLCAAIQTARGGRLTLVIDAKDIGWGCSSRNGGQVSSSIKPDYGRLSKLYGTKKACQILEEGKSALDWIGNFIKQENINCSFQVIGRFHGAHTPKYYEAMGRQLKQRSECSKSGLYLVPRTEQLSEIDTDLYHGGLVSPKSASLDPAAYHRGVLECATTAGVQVVGNCKALDIEPSCGSSAFRIHTDMGIVESSDVIVATSGYTGSLTPWQQRRVIPIGSYIVATEDLGIERASRLIPKGKNITDSRRLVVYYRLSPDRRRLLFGGRVSLRETDTRSSALKLHNEMTNVFPQLKDVKVTHSWMGFVGWTFGKMPHLGKHR